MKESLNKIGHIILKIFIIITSPIWFFWKLLFVRKPENKFKNVSTSKKVFRLVRAPITLPLKFICFAFIISIELLIIYKVRYSPLTYHFTRNSVYNYYVKETNTVEELLGITPVYAANIDNHREEFKKAFAYIDEWDLNAKNKMYVILDSDFIKYALKEIDSRNVSYILNRFNTDAEFRARVSRSCKNVNNFMHRFIRELGEYIDLSIFNFLFESVANLTSLNLDYRQVLDILGTAYKLAFNSSDYNGKETYTPEYCLDMAMDFIEVYSDGKSLKETLDYLDLKYDLYDDGSEFDSDLNFSDSVSTESYVTAN